MHNVNFEEAFVLCEAKSQENNQFTKPFADLKL